MKTIVNHSLRSLLKSCFVAAGLTTFITAAATAPGDPTEVRHCQFCNITEGGGHWFVNFDCFQGESGCYDCHSLNSCHPDVQSGLCAQFHNDCAASFALNRDALKTALATGDVDALLTLVRSNDKISWNRSRQLLQVLDCGGMVAWQSGVAPAVAISVEAALSD